MAAIRCRRTCTLRRKERFTCCWVLVPLLLVLTIEARPSAAWIFRPIEQIQTDYLALTRRVTARHILLPRNSEPVCLALKQKIRRAAGTESYLVDAFAQAAVQYSRDDTTAARGGLIGELVPQGYCASQELDRACFEARLGVVEGPIASELGNHLILVTERTNCPKLDGKNTKLVRKDDSSYEAVLVPSPQVGQADLSFAVGQVFFWIGVFFAGGILAEVVSALLS